MRKTTAPKPTTGDRALNAALAAGFEVTRHFPQRRRGTYIHELAHADGRALRIVKQLGTSRLVEADGLNRDEWRTRRLNCRSVPALERLLAL